METLITTLLVWFAWNIMAPILAFVLLLVIYGAFVLYCNKEESDE